jgi:hypothetical protein
MYRRRGPMKKKTFIPPVLRETAPVNLTPAAAFRTR